MTNIKKILLPASLCSRFAMTAAFSLKGSILVTAGEAIAVACGSCTPTLARRAKHCINHDFQAVEFCLSFPTGRRYALTCGYENATFQVIIDSDKFP
jgi:hypothetical protein